jgi:hypothetical protein
LHALPGAGGISWFAAETPNGRQIFNDARSFNGVSSDDAMAGGFAIVRFACEQSHLAAIGEVEAHH